MKIALYLVMAAFLVPNVLWAWGSIEVFEENYKVGDDLFTVSVDVDGGKVEFIKNDKDNQCHVLLKYPTERCEQEVEFDRGRNRLEIVVDHEWMSGKEKNEDNHTELMISLPTGCDISLQTDVKAGEITFELGGLKIKNFEMHNWAGEVNIDFDEPNRTVLENFDVDVKIGELDIRRLGNANFEQADINGGIGELSVDFSGEKIRNARADVDLDIGETTITVPEDIGVKMRVSKFLFLSEVDYPNWFRKSGRYHYSRNCENGDENLYLSVSTGIGEFKVRVR